MAGFCAGLALCFIITAQGPILVSLSFPLFAHVTQVSTPPCGGVGRCSVPQADLAPWRVLKSTVSHLCGLIHLSGDQLLFSETTGQVHASEVCDLSQQPVRLGVLSAYCWHFPRELLTCAMCRRMQASGRALAE